MKYQLPFSGEKAWNKAISEAWQEKGNMGSKQKVQTRSLGKIFNKKLWNIINYCEWCIHVTLLQVMVPDGRRTNYSHSHEFRQIICPSNKHRRNKHNFGKIFKIQLFEVDFNNKSISCNCYIKIIISHNRNTVGTVIRIVLYFLLELWFCQPLRFK